MALNRFAIQDADHHKFGALIKRWARLEVQPPGSIEELKKQLAANGIAASFPTGAHELKKLSFIWGSTERLDIRLPPVDHLKESEEHLATNEYELPSFYEAVFHSKPLIADRIGFHNARIGDYTVANCI